MQIKPTPLKLINRLNNNGAHFKICSIVSCFVSVILVELILLCESRASNESHDKTNLKTRENSGWAVMSQVKLDEIDSTSQPLRCVEAEKELDRCSAQIIGLESPQITDPGSLAQFDSIFCPKFKSAVNCIKDNLSCYSRFQRQVIDWILTSTRRMNYKRCRNNDEKDRFLRLTQSCLSFMPESVDNCLSQYVGSLEAIADFARPVELSSNDDIQIQLACCANKRYKQCILNNAKQQCKPERILKKQTRFTSVSSHRAFLKHKAKSTSDMMEDLKRTLDGMSLTGPEFVCDSVSEKFCKLKYDTGFKGPFTPKHMSIVPAMIRIYSGN